MLLLEKIDKVLITLNESPIGDYIPIDLLTEKLKKGDLEWNKEEILLIISKLESEKYTQLDPINHHLGGYALTFDGRVFIAEGGYKGRSSETDRLKTLETHQMAMEVRVFWLTVLIALGTLIAASYYLNELCRSYHWCPFCR